MEGPFIHPWVRPSIRPPPPTCPHIHSLLSVPVDEQKAGVPAAARTEQWPQGLPRVVSVVARAWGSRGDPLTQLREVD